MAARRPHRHLVLQALAALREIFAENRPAETIVAENLRSHPKWGSRDRRFFAECVYECVRWWRWYWNVAGLPDAACLSAASLTDERLWRVWGAWWVLAHDEELPDFAALAAPFLTRNEMKHRAAGKWPMAIRQSIPDWLDVIGRLELPDWDALLPKLNEPADVFLRVNTARISRDDAMVRLQARGHACKAVPGLPAALRLLQRANLASDPLYLDGLVEIQDASSQRVAPFLDLAPGMTVIDACAGGGGKTLHLAELLGGRGKLVALDVEGWKLAELQKRAARAAAMPIRTLRAEEASLAALQGTADRVLIDAPCSGLGVLRRQADTKWKLSLERLAFLTELQQSLLRRYAKLLKPGGKLVYATCSILPRENERQVEAFLAATPACKLEAQDSPRPTDESGGDGFYMARLRFTP